MTVDGQGGHLVLGPAHYKGAFWVTGYSRPVEAKRMQLRQPA